MPMQSVDGASTPKPHESLGLVRLYTVASKASIGLDKADARTLYVSTAVDYTGFADVRLVLSTAMRTYP